MMIMDDLIINNPPGAVVCVESVVQQGGLQADLSSRKWDEFVDGVHKHWEYLATSITQC